MRFLALGSFYKDLLGPKILAVLRSYELGVRNAYLAGEYARASCSSASVAVCSSGLTLQCPFFSSVKFDQNNEILLHLLLEFSKNLCNLNCPVQGLNSCQTLFEVSWCQSHTSFPTLV